ncbi:MAG TPA: SCO1664 family protein [Anaerolineales bacterium]
MEKDKILKYLATGDITVIGQFTWGSNYTFLTKVSGDGSEFEAVYKPQRGERPLWDFPAESLAGREVAAFLVSEALGWDLVPPTVFREDGPLGAGSLQHHVPHDPEQHYFTFDRKTRKRLRQVAAFDLLVNNADRKGGHILLGDEGKLWLIDHGISFHAEPKLRTVVWDFVGEDFPDDLLQDLLRLQSQLTPNSALLSALAPYLHEDELAALEARLAQLLAERRFPAPPEDVRATPWPLV